jgi:hypothetical protein
MEQTLDSLGGPFQDQEPVEDPTSQVSAALYNKMLEIVARASRSVVRGWVSFLTDSGSGVPIAVSVVDAVSVWGSGSGQYPTISKTTDPGVYTVTYDDDYDDDLGVTENVSIRFADGSLNGSTFGLVQCELTSAKQITVRVADTDGTLDDHSGGKLVVVWFR